MQNPFHKLTLGGALAAAGAVAVQVYDPTVVSPKVSGLVAGAGLLVSLIGSLFHTNKQSAAIQAIEDTVAGLAAKQQQGKP